jgi:hypothetical protein
LSDSERRGAPLGRTALGLEAAALFAGLPLLVYFEPFPIPKIPALVLFALYAWWKTARDSAFDKRKLRLRDVDFKTLRRSSLRAAALLVALGAYVYWRLPESFLVFPRERPEVWIAVALLYPLFSALPQELIYRSFFFWRYRRLFPSRLGMIAASAAAFAFLHIIYDNWHALALTAVGGVVFTVGLGRFFYEG